MCFRLPGLRWWPKRCRSEVVSRQCAILVKLAFLDTGGSMSTFHISTVIFSDYRQWAESWLLWLPNQMSHQMYSVQDQMGGVKQCGFMTETTASTV